MKISLGSHEKEIQRIRQAYEERDASGLSSEFTYTNPAFLFHMQERERSLLEMLREERVILEGAHVLELGCGTGHILQRFLEFGAGRAAGIDLMEGRLRSGAEAYPNLRLIQGNGAQLPFRDGSFDIVMHWTCLSSVLDSSLRRDMASEMWRVLKPGGVILSYDLRPRPFLGRLCSKMRGPSRSDPSREGLPSTPVRSVSLDELRTLFPQGQMRGRSLSLDFALLRRIAKYRGLAMILSWLPFLRNHYLVLIRKTF